MPPVESDDFCVLLEAFTPERRPTKPDPEQMDISPARPSQLMQLVSNVVNLMSSPLKSAPDATQGSEERGAGGRPKRNVSRPLLYQSEVEAEKEKEKRKGLGEMV